MTAITQAILVSTLAFVWMPSPDDWDPPCRGIDCEIGGGGTYVGLTEQETRSLARVYPPGSTPELPDQWYQYVAVIDCTGNDPDFPDRVHCEFAVTYCEERVPESSGPYSRIYRRVVDSSGPVGTWGFVGPTCFRSVVPERSGESAPELTDAMILEQFHRTQFALPESEIQPPDGRALVNLPVYFELEWPEEGYEPMEVDTTDILGFEVRIRPTLDSVTYHFGDGGSLGPTTSLGGGYPDGDVTHEYTAAADVGPWITVVYGGEVSVDGGAWDVIPGSVTVEGPPNDLEILTSTNRLYDD